MKYQVSFEGRKAGAIGIFYRNAAQVEIPDDAADVTEAVRLAVHYAGFEHVTKMRMVPIQGDGTLYGECVARGIQTANHESDLYIPSTDETRELVAAFDANHSEFANQLHGGQWLDVTFAYLPWWAAKQEMAK